MANEGVARAFEKLHGRSNLDDRAIVRSDWTKKGIYDILDKLYSEIWIYGNQELYDPVEEYAISHDVSRKMVFTGYIPRKVPTRNMIQKSRKEMGLGEKDQLVVVTTGGGGDGYRVMDTYLSMLESEFQSPLPFKSVLITGPFMPKKLRKKVFKRSKALGIKTFHFYRNMEKLLAAADLVVSMGGYNTMCELLSLGTTSLIVPRETPRKEQLIRADIFKRQNLIDYLPWSKCRAPLMAQKVRSLLSSPEPYQSAISRFQMTGIEVMRSRLHSFKYSEMEACSHLTLIKQTG